MENKKKVPNHQLDMIGHEFDPETVYLKFMEMIWYFP